MKRDELKKMKKMKGCGGGGGEEGKLQYTDANNRNEIADCSERAFNSLPISEAIKLLQVADVKQLKQYAEKEQVPPPSHSDP